MSETPTERKLRELYESRNEHSNRLTAVEIIVKDVKQFVEHGLMDAIVKEVREALLDQQHKEWEREHEMREKQLEGYKAHNAAIGAAKDAEQKRKDRQTKILLGFMPVFIVVVTALINKWGG